MGLLSSKQSSNFHCAVLLTFLTFTSVVSQQIVIDTKAPIVIHDAGISENDKSIRDDNYFGYSLAFQKNFSSSRQTHGTLYIGSPNEKRLTKNFGVIWGCQFSGNGELRCSAVSTISNHNPEGPVTPSCTDNTKFTENETEQWIGSSLSANDDYLFACAPRWKINNYRSRANSYSQYTTCSAETAMVGACYMVDPQKKVSWLSPFSNEGANFLYTLQNRQGTVSGYYLVYAEFGFSSHIASIPRSPRVFIGSPAARSWKGNLFEYRYRNDEDRGQETVYNKEGKLSTIAEHSYFGYSLTSGKYVGNAYYVAVGAPRAENLRGVVQLIPFEQNYPLSPGTASVTYRGEQFGSYFGYSVATVDLNGDGIDELLVGAPWQACVFLYDVRSTRATSPIKRFCQNRETLVSRGSRFGTSIVNMKDINFDMFEDFAVGAPYSDDGVGSVYIFYGNAKFSELSEIPAQVVQGKSFEIPSLRGFGSFLLSGGNVDIDGNSTPDLAVGAYESRHVIVLRTRPVAKAFMTITFHNGDSEAREIFKLLPGQENILVRICTRFWFSVALPFQLKLNVWLKLEMDHREKRFHPVNVERTYEVSAVGKTCVNQSYRLTKEEISNSEYQDISFRSVLYYNDTEELLESRPVHAYMELSSEWASKQQRLPEFSSDKDSTYEDAFRQFNTFLPAPIPYTESKQTLVIAQDNCDSDGNRQCTPDLRINLQLETEDIERRRTKHNLNKLGEANLIIGEVNSLILKITLSNYKETAYQPTVGITFAMSDGIDLEESKGFLQFKWLQTPERQNRLCAKDKKDDKNTVNSLIRCSQPLQTGKQMQYSWSVGNLRELKVKASSKGIVNLKVEAFPGEFKQQKVEDVVIIPLKPNVDITVEDSMSGTGQSVIDPRSNNVDLIQFYIITNRGFTSTVMDAVEIEILVPTHVHIEKNFTQVVGVVNPSNQFGHNIRCMGNFFDPSTALGRKTKDKMPDPSTKISKQSRTTRSVGDTKGETIEKKEPPKLKVSNPEAATLVTSMNGNMITLTGCDTTVGAASCQKIICQTDLPSKGSKEIRLHMYILPDAIKHLVEEDTSGIRIESVISVSYLKKKVKTITGRTERKFLLVKGIPAYVYLLSAAGGTILLLLVTFALFKCGFFRRKTKEQLQELKRKTMMLGEVGQLPDFEELRDDDDNQ